MQPSQELEPDSFRGICACISEFLRYERLEGSLEVGQQANTFSQPCTILHMQASQFCATSQAFTIETASKSATPRGLGDSKQKTSERTYMRLVGT